MSDIPVHKILKDQTRQEIVKLLGERENATYTDLLGHLQISTGRLNYHLKILAPFLLKQDGNYSLNDTGKNLFMVFESFPMQNKPSEKNIFSMLGWMLLLISLSSFYFMIPSKNTAIDLVGIISMILSQFMFYYAGKFNFSTMEYLAILLISLLFSGAAITNGFMNFQINTFSLNLDFNIPIFIAAALLCGSSLSWAQTSIKRIMLTTGSFIFESFVLYTFLLTGNFPLLLFPAIAIPSLIILIKLRLSLKIKEFLIAFSVFFMSLVISILLMGIYYTPTISVTFPLPMLAIIMLGKHVIKNINGEPYFIFRGTK